MVWKVGQSGNPFGRPRENKAPPPKVNLRDYYLREELHRALADGLEDPLRFQHQQMMNPELPAPIRAAIAAQITPYYHPRLGSITPPNLIEVEVTVPRFETIDQAESFILDLAAMVGDTKLSMESAKALTDIVTEWIHSKRAGEDIEIKRLNAGQSDGEQVIRVVGGLPTIPGTDIIMPGDPADPTLVNGPTLEYTPGESVPMDSIAQTKTASIWHSDGTYETVTVATDRSTDRSKAPVPGE
jgi:hypothetical protein